MTSEYKNVLVTGGAGFIGSHLVNLLVKLGHNVTVLDNLSSGSQEKINVACEFVKGDIRDHKSVSQAVRGKEVIFHLAAFTSVAGSIDDPDTCLDVNVNGMENLLKNAEQAGVCKVVFSSTSAVYPEFPDILRSESSPTRPISPYAESKIQGEYLLQQIQGKGSITASALRYFNVFGPGQNIDSEYAAVIPVFVSQVQNNQTLTIYGNGRQTRDFVYVEDVAMANVLAMNSLEFGTFNVGTSIPISILDLAEILIQMSGSKSECVFEDSRPGDVLSSTADISLIRDRLGWAPEWDLASGLKEIMRVSTSNSLQHQTEKPIKRGSID